MGTILCFGDSITFGEGYDGGWCGYLKRWFEALEDGNKVYNLGVGGAKSSELLDRFDIESKARIRFNKPTNSYTTLIAIGVNDAKYNGSISRQNAVVSEAEFTGNIIQIIKKARSFNQKVACIGLLPVDEVKTHTLSDQGIVLVNERVTEFNNIIRECCKSEGVSFLDLNKIMLKKKDYQSMLEDGVHPTPKGYRFVFTKVRGFLKKNDLFP